MSSRKCHVIKQESEEFEFFLKVDQSRKGQIITSVTKDGPAQRAGLKDGDRIIEINGINVESKDHNTIVGLIRECIPRNEITFLVIDVKSDPNTKKSSSSQKKKSSSDVDSRPRICKIKKKNNSFGFFLEAHGESDPGHFIKQVTKGGAADGTGLLAGDRIIAVGKTNVENESHQQVVNLIKKSGQKIALLVIDDDGYKDLKQKGIPITEKLAKGGSTSSSRKSSSSVQKSVKTAGASAAAKQVANNLRGKVRVIHVLKHPEHGYGFYLRSKKTEEGEFVGDVDKKGCADVCGLMNDDRVMAVNGQSIIGMSHADVIGLVKSKQSQFVFVVMDKEAMEKFKKNDSFPSEDDIVHSHQNIIRSHQLTKGSGSLGMSLRLDKGHPFHVISDVEPDGVAENAGLKNDDILIAVNDSNVLRDSHEECIQKIKGAGESMELTVGDRKAAGFVRECGVTFSAELVREWPTEEEMSVPSFGKSPPVIEEAESSPAPVKEAVALAIVDNVVETDLDLRPRLCRVKRQGDAFGFFLKDDNGHFLTNVEKDGPASKAGVLEYDRIIEINGTNVEKKTHNEVVNIIRQSQDVVTFLVVNEEEDSYFKKKGIVITAALLATSDEIADEHRPRLCHLTRTSTAYGFHLTGDGDREGQFIREILPGGAADLAGVKEGDRIIEVNGVNVMNESHDVIVKKVTERKDEVTFLVIDKEGEEYYKQRGVIIAATLIAAKVAEEIRDEVLEENKGDDASIGGSASSSIIETEATVHKEDVQEEEDRDVDVVKVAAAAAIIHEVVENEQERREEEIREEMKQDLVESLAEKIESEEEPDHADAPVAPVAAVVDEIINEKESNEEKSDDGREEDMDIGKKAAIAVVAAATVDEVLDEMKEDSRPPTPESPLLSADKDEETLAEKVEEIIEDIKEEQEEKESAVEIAQEIIEEAKEEDESVVEVISNHIEEMQEEDDVETKAKKVAAALIANEIRDRYSDKNSDTDSAQDEKEEPRDEEENKLDYQEEPDNSENEIGPEFVATAAAVAVAVKRTETPENRSRKSSISDDDEPVELVKGKVVKEVPEPPPAKTPDPKPLAAIVTETVKEPPKWKRPSPEPQKQEPFRFGQDILKPVKRFPEVQPAQTPPSTPNDVNEPAPTRSSVVAAMRAQFEKNSQKQNSGFANAVQEELAQLSIQKGEANKRIQMFGGGATKPKENGQAPQMKKQISWTGQGMSIKIVES